MAKDRLDAVPQQNTQRFSPSETQQLGDVVGDGLPKNVPFRQNLIPKAEGIDGRCDGRPSAFVLRLASIRLPLHLDEGPDGGRFIIEIRCVRPADAFPIEVGDRDGLFTIPNDVPIDLTPLESALF
ncbi:hypothetical protein D3C72_1730650 [compost metagenome]